MGGGGLAHFLGKAHWLYPRKGAPVSRHALTVAVDRLDRLQKLVDRGTYSSLLRRCGDIKAVEEGRRMHGIIVQRGRAPTTFHANLIVEMYGKLGLVEDACEVFAKRPHKRNVHSWMNMIAVYARNGLPREALHLFQCMFLVGYSLSMSMRSIFVDVYTQCGHLEAARQVLEELHETNVLLWNVLIAAYVDKGRNREALHIAHTMDCKPTSDTFVSLAAACAKLEDYAAGKEIHEQIVSSKLQGFASVCCALINMYSKCHKLDDARIVFDRRESGNVIACWTAMISAYTENGHGREALLVYKQMDQEGVLPDDVTYAAALDACAIAGALAERKAIVADACVLQPGFVF